MAVLRSAALLLAIGLALSACQVGRSEQPVATPSQAATMKPAAGPATMPAPAPRVAALPPIDDDPTQLLGLDRDGVSALLGTPDLIRREAAAEIWQYVASGCVFDVVLYERGTGFAVSYLEARDATAGVQPAQTCLNELLRARQTAPVG